MPTDTSKVYVPQPPRLRGVVFRALLGTALPTDAATPLPPVYHDLGGIAETGIVNAQARDVKKVKDFAGDIIATPQSDYSETLEVEFVEATNLDALKAVFGDVNVTFTPATATAGALIQVDHNSTVLPKCVIVTDTVQGAGMRRQIAPLAQPIKVADVSQINTDIVKYKVTFECFKYLDPSGTSAFNIREYVYDGRPVILSNEVQTVTITGNPTGGTFTLTFGGQTTTGIPYNAPAAVVQSALGGLSTVGAGNVAVSGSASGPYVVTFGGTLAGAAQPLITASGTGLTGGSSPAVSVVETTQGGR